MSQSPFREPVHVYNIPQEVLSGLQLRPSPLASLDPSSVDGELPPLITDPEEISNRTVANALTCALCLGVSFKAIDEQRLHWRSDWHRYNVQLRIQDPKSQPISEEKFNQMIEGIDESLSDTASEGSDSADSPDAVASLLNKNRQNRRHRSPSPTSAALPNIPRAPIWWYQSPNVPDTQFGVYRTIFSLDTPPESSLDELRKMQDGGENGRLWTLFMVAGGHFAGLVVRVCFPSTTKGKDGKESKKGVVKGAPKPEMEILQSKTFHRYTTRRKQGGSQSVNDNAKGLAKSAGALLRRYGEQSLREDIRALLDEWREEINASERIFLRANVSNKRTFVDFEGTPIPKGDSRLRTFPFPTRRPNQPELIRCLTEMTRVKITRLTEEELKAQDQAILDSLPKPKPIPKPVAQEVASATTPSRPKLSKEEELIRDKWRRFLDMIRRGRTESLKSFWEKESSALLDSDPNAKVPDWVDASEGGGAGWTLLQIASAAGQDEVVRWLLEDLRSNPCIALPAGTSYGDPDGNNSDSDAPVSSSNRRVAYDVASTKQTRNVYRRLAWAHPDWWDWVGEGRVPSALSPAMEEEREKKKTGRRKGMREKAKEREAARLKEQAEAAARNPPIPASTPKAQPPKPEPKSGPQKLGSSSAADKEKQSVAGLTPEMRARIERERRARAAEARLKGA
ncbi:hypothetical protein FRC03_000346 [Tulasnella sp. 419]|nr:hypothetical protein FRC03_000346 [Tulasnella sp. 419]